mmetsp:Transcript_30457/g.72421  ORF Transcript_30457/g.72421 Transcript_30457/m.72421 type:complete len:203 (+) Transcript_30457:388-996(+)
MLPELRHVLPDRGVPAHRAGGRPLGPRRGVLQLRHQEGGHGDGTVPVGGEHRLRPVRRHDVRAERHRHTAGRCAPEAEPELDIPVGQAKRTPRPHVRGARHAPDAPRLLLQCLLQQRPPDGPDTIRAAQHGLHVSNLRVERLPGVDGRRLQGTVLSEHRVVHGLGGVRAVLLRRVLRLLQSEAQPAPLPGRRRRRRRQGGRE